MFGGFVMTRDRMSVPTGDEDSGSRRILFWAGIGAGLLTLVLIVSSLFSEQLSEFDFGKLFEREETIIIKAPTDDGTRFALPHYLLRLAGSNSIGGDLAPKLAEGYLATLGASDIQINQRQNAKGEPIPERVITGRIAGRLAGIEVKAYGSGTAFEALAKQEADIGMASRPIKPGEEKGITNLGPMTGAGSEHVIALDGIAVIVNPANPVRQLSRQQLKDIFTGKVASWNEVGVPLPGPIDIYARDDKSGTYDAFKDIVLGESALKAGIKRFADSALLEAQVARDMQGIGFVSQSYVKQARALAIADGALPAVAPGRLSIKTETYLLSRRLYLYTPTPPTSPHVFEFVTFATGETGHDIARKAGFFDVGITVDAGRAVAAAAGCALSSQWPGDRQAYCKLRHKAQPVETAFRFKPGSEELDNRAARDLQRLIAVAQTHPKARFALAAFSAPEASYADSCVLSEARAQVIAVQLKNLGLNVGEARGYCGELPVRDPADPRSRMLNDRIEVYLY